MDDRNVIFTLAEEVYIRCDTYIQQGRWRFDKHIHWLYFKIEGDRTEVPPMASLIWEESGGLRTHCFPSSFPHSTSFSLSLFIIIPSSASPIHRYHYHCHGYHNLPCHCHHCQLLTISIVCHCPLSLLLLANPSSVVCIHSHCYHLSLFDFRITFSPVLSQLSPFLYQSLQSFESIEFDFFFSFTDN